MAIVIASGVTSTGLILGNNTVAGAMDTTASAFGTAVDTIVSNGAILQISSGGVGSGAVISGDTTAANKAQEIVRAGGVSYDTVVNQGIGYQYVAGGVAYRTVISNGSQWGANNAKMYDTIVRGGSQILANTITAYGTIVSGGSVLVSSGATISDAVLSGGRFSVWGGGTVNNITIMIGNGKNAVIRPEENGTVFTGSLTMDFTTAVSATTSANYFISSVARVAANAGVTYTIKVKQEGQYSGEYCMGGGSTNITATVVTDTGLTLGNVTGGGATNGAYLHTQFGSYRFYTSTYQYVSIVADPVAVFEGATVVARGTTVDTAITIDSTREAYVRKGGTLKDLTIDAAADGKIKVFSGGVLESATITGATAGYVAVSNGGLANNVTLAGASAYLRLSGGTANDAVVSAGTLYLLAAGAEAYRTTASAGIVDISAGRTESTTLLGAAREMVRNGAAASCTVIEAGATGNQFVRAGGIAYNTIVRGGSQQLYDANAKAYDAVVSGGAQQLYAGASAVRTILRGGNQTTVSGAVAVDTVISGGTQSIVAGATASNTTIVAGNGARMRLEADAALTAGALTWDLSEMTAAPAADYNMLNAWRVTAGTDLYVTVKAEGQTAGNYYLSSGAGSFNSTITVKDTDDNVLGTLGKGDSFVYGLSRYTLTVGSVITNGLVLTVGSMDHYPVEIYTGSTLTASGTVVTGTTIDAGMLAYVRDGGTLESATINGAGANNILISSGGLIKDATLTGVGAQTDIRVYAGGSAQGTIIDTAATDGAIAIQRLSGGTGVGTVIAGAKGQELVYAGAAASNTVIKVDGAAQKLLAANAKAYDTVISAGSQQVGAANAAAYDTIVYGGGQLVTAVGAVASDTVIYGGSQQVSSGASAWNTTIVAGNGARVSLSDGAVTGGTWNFDLSQGAPTATSMLNAWRITAGTDLVITVKTTDPWAGKYYLSSGAGYFTDQTFTVKDTAGNVLASDFGNGDSVKVGDFTYKLAVEGSGLYLTVNGYPVEIYSGTELTGYGTTVSGANIVAGMSAYVYDGGTLADAQVVGAGGGNVLISSGGVASNVVISGNVAFTDVRAFAGGVVSGALVADHGMLRLSGGSGADTIISGGQLLMYAGAVASGTIVGDEGSQKLLAPGTVAYDTVISSGGWMQVGATPEQTSGSYIAGGEAHGIVVRSDAAVRVYSSAAATGVSVDDGGSAYVFSGGRIGFGTVASGAEFKVRFSEVDGNDTALISDWGSFDAGAKLVLGEFGGVGTYALADSGNTAISSAYLEIGLTSRTAAVGGYFSDAFRELDLFLSAGATGVTISEFATPVAVQSAAAAFSATTATALADGGFAAIWDADTTYSGNVTLAGSSLAGNVWLTLDGFANNNANLYGAEGGFANGVNWRLSSGKIKNLAGGAKLGGSVAGVDITVEDGMTVAGAVYAGGMGDVTDEIGMQIEGGTFAGNVFAGALCNYAANGQTTGTGRINLTVDSGSFKGDLYAGAAVKAGSASTVVHTAGDILVELNGGAAAKGAFCVYGGGYATGTVEDALVYEAGDVDITVNDGSWGTYLSGRGIFGGVYADKVAAAVGNVDITVAGGTMGNVYGGGWAQNGGTSTVTGEVNITISGDAAINNVFGGGSYSNASYGATSVGSVNITVSGGAIYNNIFAGGQGEYSTVAGDIDVTFSGANAYSCNVYGYSVQSSATAGGDKTLAFAGYTGTLSGNVGGFDAIVFAGNAAATLTGAIDNGDWFFDYTGRTSGANTAMLTLDDGTFAGDNVAVDLSEATQAANGWSIATGLTAANAAYSVELATGSADGLALGDALDSSFGIYEGWGFALEDSTLKFKQLA